MGSAQEPAKPEETIRIISAREADSAERRIYTAKPLTKRQKSVLDKIAARQARGDDSQIDYSDIPALSKKQLAELQRAPKKLDAHQ